MKTHNIILVALVGISLSACQTFEGLKKDFSSVGNAVGTQVNNLTTENSDKPENIAATVINDGTCPPIFVDPQLSSMSEFYDPKNPKTGTEISMIGLTDTKTACQKEGEYLEVKIELVFKGELGPKAKRKDNDRPFFAYPYFISVMDNKNTELAKELFAASMIYDKDQNKMELVETIRQKLPLNDDGSMPPYEIKIGFQLTEEQLFYNASR